MKMIDLLKIAAYMLFPAAMFSGCNEDEVGPDYPAPQPVTKIGKAIVEKTSLIASLSTDTTWTVFPGIEATQLRYLAYDGMPQMMFFYEVDLTVENITISQTTPYNENIGAADPEPATRQALHVDAPGFKIWGGSNSDFGSESQKMPQGIFHHNGVCYKSTFNSTPARPRSFFYLTNDKKAYTADASEYEAIAESRVILEACGGVEATDNTTLNVYNTIVAGNTDALGYPDLVVTSGNNGTSNLPATLAYSVNGSVVYGANGTVVSGSTFEFETMLSALNDGVRALTGSDNPALTGGMAASALVGITTGMSPEVDTDVLRVDQKGNDRTGSAMGAYVGN